MVIRERYDDETGVLQPGTVRYATDEVTVRDPWPTDLESCLGVIGRGSPQREAFAWHLAELAGWVAQALRSDPGRRLWLRGTFASTIWPDVDEVDVVLIYDDRVLARSDRWVLQLLASGPIELHPGRLSVTAIRHNVDSEMDIDREARRSAVRVTDPHTGNQLVTGWLEIEEGGAR